MNIGCRFDHYNFNVFDLDKSLEFYDKALGLKEMRRVVANDGSFVLVFLGDGKTDFLLELTWLKDRETPYDPGDNELHLCVRTDGDYDAVRSYHKENGWVCYENQGMGLYFINDPDDHWIEILPAHAG